MIHAKITNTFLRRALKNFAAAYPVARAKAFEGTDFEGVRTRISDFKREGLKVLPELIEQFTSAASATGAHVHLCATPEDANRTILAIIKSKGAHLLIKSKAMTSEEIELNPYLEKNGIHCLETDLGEWIIQLAGERPSHMVNTICWFSPMSGIASTGTGFLGSPGISQSNGATIKPSKMVVVSTATMSIFC